MPNCIKDTFVYFRCWNTYGDGKGSLKWIIEGPITGTILVSYRKFILIISNLLIKLAEFSLLPESHPSFIHETPGVKRAGSQDAALQVAS